MNATHTLTLVPDKDEPEILSRWEIACHGKLTDCNHLTYCKDCTKDDREKLYKRLEMEYELDDWGEATVHGVEHVYSEETSLWCVWEDTCIATEWQESISQVSVEEVFIDHGAGEHEVGLEYFGEGIWDVLPADKKETGE